VGEFVVEIGGGASEVSYGEVAAHMDKLQACAEAAIARRLAGPEEEEDRDELAISLEHYHPFNDKIPGGFSGGDVVATLKKGENYATGSVVYFFANNSSFFRMRYDSSEKRDKHEVFGRFSRYAFDVTNQGGRGTYNYLWHGSINYPELAKVLEASGQAKVTITAVVFDRDPLTTAGEKAPQVEDTETIELMFKGAARIVSVRSSDPTVADPLVEVARGGRESIKVAASTVRKVDSATGYSGYNLLPGDKIILEEMDQVDVHWMTGMRTRFEPNKTYFGEDKRVRAEIEVGSSDAGWLSYLDSWVNHPRLAAGLTITGASASVYGAVTRVAVGTAAGWTSPAGWAVTAVGVLGLVWSGAMGYHSPLVMHAQSQVLLDSDGQAVTVHTLEGTATLHDLKTGEPKTVAEGRKRTVSETGMVGDATRFQRSDLSEHLRGMADRVQESAAAIESASSGSGEVVGATEDDRSSARTTGTIVVGCGCLGIIALMAIVIVLLVRRRKRRRQQADADNGDAPTMVRPEPAMDSRPVTPLPVLEPRPAPRRPVRQAPPAQHRAEPDPEPEVRFCPNCGARRREGAVFCVECGTRIS